MRFSLLAVVASLGAQDKSVADICQVLRNSEAYNGKRVSHVGPYTELPHAYKWLYGT